MCTRCGPVDRCKIRLPRRPGTGSSRAERPVRPSDRPSDPVRTGPIRVGRAPSRAPLCRVMCPPDAGRWIGVKFGVPGGPGTGSFRAELCGALPGLGVLKSGLTKTKTDRRVLKSGQTKTDSGHVFFEIRSNNARFRTGVCLNPGEQRTSPDRCFLNPGEHGRCPDTITKYE